MTPDTIRQAIYDQIEATWATTDTIAWPNHSFSPDPVKAWMRPKIQMVPSEYGELGMDDDAGVGIRVGLLMLQIFVPGGTGMKNVGVHAGNLETAFRKKDLSGVIFGEAYTVEVGLGKDENFFQVNVYAPFHAFIGE